MSGGPSVRVKICGITDEDDARAVASAGADALGFIGFAKSKRYVDPESVVDWLHRLPPFVSRVAVLVNPASDEVLRLARPGAFDTIQLHGDERPEFVAEMASAGVRIIKAIRPQTAELGVLMEECRPYLGFVSALLVDSFEPGSYGGTGKVGDWNVAGALARAVEPLPLILSGGLTPGNVPEAIQAVRPYAVDVAGGVEASPGKKDLQAVVDFVACAGRRPR